MLDFLRQTEIVSPDQLAGYPVTLIGAGGIGSSLAVVLTKLGVTDLTVYDPDIVESHNLPSQFYRLQDVGRLKVEALAAVCSEFAGVKLTTHNRLFSPQDVPQGIVITAVDSMSARHEIWRNSVRLKPSVACYIDARMGGEEGRVYTVRPSDLDDIDHYEGTLYSDAEASELPCSARAISYNTAFLAGLIASQVQKFVMQKEFKIEVIFDLVSLTLITPRTQGEV